MRNAKNLDYDSSIIEELENQIALAVESQLPASQIAESEDFLQKLKAQKKAVMIKKNTYVNFNLLHFI